MKKNINVLLSLALVVSTATFAMNPGQDAQPKAEEPKAEQPKKEEPKKEESKDEAAWYSRAWANAKGVYMFDHLPAKAQGPVNKNGKAPRGSGLLERLNANRTKSLVSVGAWAATAAALGYGAYKLYDYAFGADRAKQLADKERVEKLTQHFIELLEYAQQLAHDTLSNTKNPNTNNIDSLHKKYQEIKAQAAFDGLAENDQAQLEQIVKDIDDVCVQAATNKIERIKIALHNLQLFAAIAIGKIDPADERAKFIPVPSVVTEAQVKKVTPGAAGQSAREEARAKRVEQRRALLKARQEQRAARQAEMKKAGMQATSGQVVQNTPVTNKSATNARVRTNRFRGALRRGQRFFRNHRHVCTACKNK